MFRQSLIAIAATIMTLTAFSGTIAVMSGNDNVQSRIA